MKGKGTVRRASRVGRAASWAAAAAGAADEGVCSGAAPMVAAWPGRPSSPSSLRGIACGCLSGGG